MEYMIAAGTSVMHICEDVVVAGIYRRTNVELDGAVDQRRGRLQQDGLRLVGTPPVQRHLRVTALIARHSQNVLHELQLVHLLCRWRMMNTPTRAC